MFDNFFTKFICPWFHVIIWKKSFTLFHNKISNRLKFIIIYFNEYLFNDNCSSSASSNPRKLNHFLEISPVIKKEVFFGFFRVLSFVMFFFYSISSNLFDFVINKKINFIKTSLLLFSYMPFCILLTFCTLWTYFPLIQWLFHDIVFFWLSSEGTGGNEFFEEKKCRQNNFEHI